MDVLLRPMPKPIKDVSESVIIFFFESIILLEVKNSL